MRLLVTGGSGFIGTNLIDFALKNESGIALKNLDISPPKISNQNDYWEECNITDVAQLGKIFSEFHPTHVIHFAARTDTYSQRLEDYQVNTKGTEVILSAMRESSTVKRLVVTSSQFVVRPGHIPEHDEDFDPYPGYGESKVVAEKLTRDAGLACAWTIVRPTNIWGPWHPRYPYEFWRVLYQGKYFHPGAKPVVRTYGYVGTIVKQIMAILKAPLSVVNHQVFYLGDWPLDLLDWVNEFSIQITGKQVRVVPRGVVWSGALVGSLLRRLGFGFPIFLSRYRSMTEDYPAPIEKTFGELGDLSTPLEEGVKETVDWLKKQGHIRPSSKRRKA